jgi:hypothetical protein
MTDLTPRQILDAIRDALEETARRLAKNEKQGRAAEAQQPKMPTGAATEEKAARPSK